VSQKVGYSEFTAGLGLGLSPSKLIDLLEIINIWVAGETSIIEQFQEALST